MPSCGPRLPPPCAHAPSARHRLYANHFRGPPFTRLFCRPPFSAVLRRDSSLSSLAAILLIAAPSGLPPPPPPCPSRARLVRRGRLTAFALLRLPQPPCPPACQCLRITACLPPAVLAPRLPVFLRPLPNGNICRQVGSGLGGGGGGEAAWVEVMRARRRVAREPAGAAAPRIAPRAPAGAAPGPRLAHSTRCRDCPTPSTLRAAAPQRPPGPPNAHSHPPSVPPTRRAAPAGGMGVLDGADGLLQLLAARAGGAASPTPRAAARAALAAAASLRAALPFARRAQLLAAAVAASAALLAASRRARPGAARLALAAPVVALNLWLPLLFHNDSELLSRVCVSFTMTWLGCWKARGGRGGGGRVAQGRPGRGGACARARRADGRAATVRRGRSAPTHAGTHTRTHKQPTQGSTRTSKQHAIMRATTRAPRRPWASRSTAGRSRWARGRCRSWRCCTRCRCTRARPRPRGAAGARATGWRPTGACRRASSRRRVRRLRCGAAARCVPAARARRAPRTLAHSNSAVAALAPPPSAVRHGRVCHVRGAAIQRAAALLPLRAGCARVVLILKCVLNCVFKLATSPRTLGDGACGQRWPPLQALTRPRHAPAAAPRPPARPPRPLRLHILPHDGPRHAAHHARGPRRCPTHGRALAGARAWRVARARRVARGAWRVWWMRARARAHGARRFCAQERQLGGRRDPPLPPPPPPQSASLAEFWARRWNNTVGLTLRSLCYDPIIEGRLIKPPAEQQQRGSGGGMGKGAAANGGGGEAAAAAAAAAEVVASARAQPQSQPPGKGVTAPPPPPPPPPPPRARRFAATLAVFAASGLAHELVLAYVMAPFAWGICAFFIVQARGRGAPCLGGNLNWRGALPAVCTPPHAVPVDPPPRPSHTRAHPAPARARRRRSCSSSPPSCAASRRAARFPRGLCAASSPTLR